MKRQHDNKCSHDPMGSSVIVVFSLSAVFSLNTDRFQHTLNLQRYWLNWSPSHTITLDEWTNV